MGKFEGVLICTDCDGTLTDKDGNLSEENVNAIRYFQQEGGRFTLATGRFPDHLKKYEGQLKVNAPVVSLNGVLVFDTEKNEALAKYPMDTKSAMKIMQYINENWKGVWEYWINFGDETSACYKPFEDKFESETVKLDEDTKERLAKGSDNLVDRPVFNELESVLPEQTAKIVFVMPEDMLRPLQKDLRDKFHDEFNFDSSWPNGLEMQWVKSGKGVAVNFLREYFGDVHTVVCVGDYDNDISMLKIADIAYAVGNALDEVKSVSHRVTVTNNESALAHIIEDLGKENLKN